MSGPGPVPASGTPIPPPLFNFPWVRLNDGMLTIQAISQLTQFWALVVGEDGIAQNINIIFNMHGDGTLSATGLLVVTATDGVPFAYFATGTDAAHLTGTLSPARIAVDSLPYDLLLNLTAPGLLGSGAPGSVVEINLGRNITLTGGTIQAEDPTTTVGSLGAPAAGLRAFVTDSTVTAAGNFGNVVVGGGANFCPVYADSAAWRIG